MAYSVVPVVTIIKGTTTPYINLQSDSQIALQDNSYKIILLCVKRLILNFLFHEKCSLVVQILRVIAGDGRFEVCIICF